VQAWISPAAKEELANPPPAPNKTNNASDPVPSVDINELQRNPMTEIPVEGAEDECPAICASCEAGVRVNGQLACKTCQPTMGLDGPEERYLVNGECRLCNLPFCEACETRPRYPPREEQRDRLFCTQCANGTIMVDGKCATCPFKECATCGVRHAKKVEMQVKEANGDIALEAVTCIECKQPAFLVNGGCERCNNTACGTCLVRSSGGSQADPMAEMRVLGETPSDGDPAGNVSGNATAPPAPPPRVVLPAGDESPPEELVCKTCPDQFYQIDGTLSEELFLADGQCLPCSGDRFEYCQACMSDTMKIHCTTCDAPYLPLGSDDPEFYRSGLDYWEEPQCQPCKPECLDCAHRPHWCTKCDSTRGLAMALRGRRPAFSFTAATCLPVHASCRTSDVAALPSGQTCAAGPVDTELAAEYSCTSCHAGNGLEAGPDGSLSMGRCMPCHSTCQDCHRAHDDASCTACEAGKELTVLDSINMAGKCSAESCPGCVTRAQAGSPTGTAKCLPNEVFVPGVLGATAPEDEGVCKAYADDCVVKCTPEEDGSALVPLRRSCVKFCLQKKIKKTASGQSKLVVCRVMKKMECNSVDLDAQDTAADIAADVAQGTEEVERCSEEKKAECVAVLPFTEAFNTMSATGLLDAQNDMMAMEPVEDDGITKHRTRMLGSAQDGDGETVVQEDTIAVGCATLGNTTAISVACETALLMF
jgi:hypothetical protein